MGVCVCEREEGTKYSGERIRQVKSIPVKGVQLTDFKSTYAPFIISPVMMSQRPCLAAQCSAVYRGGGGGKSDAML